MSKIIGQDKLIKEVNRIFQVFINSNCEIRPHFILTGESGSGKSFTIKQLCGMNELNFLEVNAAQITKEGISGNSLSKILSPLANYSHTPIVEDNIQYSACPYCIYRNFRDFAAPCVYHETYEAIEKSKNLDELMEAIRNRADYLEELIEKVKNDN